MRTETAPGRAPARGQRPDSAAGQAHLQPVRDRRGHGQALEVSDFGHVLTVDTAADTIEAEGMVTYEALADAALAHGLMPAVVPQLKSITIGGAVSGIGIESSSFRYGLPHETVQEMDVLLGNGEVVTCTPDNTHRDLFFGLANSYGTLGYILRLKILAVPAKPFVRLSHVHCADADDFFERLAAACDSEVDFVDGVVFDRGRHYLTLGEFVDQAPYSSDYTYLQIYYRSIPARAEDYLSVRDYLWRWDTDWFWCSKKSVSREPALAHAAWARAAELDHLPEGDALEQPGRTDPPAECLKRRPSRVGDSGRRYPTGKRSGVYLIFL